jgi:YtxH-like protein
VAAILLKQQDDKWMLITRIHKGAVAPRRPQGDSMNDRTASCTSSPLSLMFYFLAGGVAGASVALLLAPQSGRSTRDLVRRNVSDAKNSARDLKENLIRRGQDLRDEARNRVDDAVSALAGDGAVKLPG